MYNDEIIISGGANSDDDARHFPLGFYRELWYARLGESVGHGFCIVTAKGTEIVENTDLNGLDLVVGCKGWVEGNSVIYMVWKPTLIHEIWRYYVLTESHVLLSADPIWNFQRDKKIQHIVVGLNNIVSWCDGYYESQEYTDAGEPLFNEPFYIDVDKFESGDYPTPLTLQDVQFIKWPSMNPPTAVYRTDLTLGDNKLRSKLVRFRSTWIYWGNEESAYTGYSALVTPTLSEMVSGVNWAESQQDNVLDVTIDTGPAVVRKINVAVSINGAQFGVFMQIDKDLLALADDTTYTFPYYGNAVTLPVPFTTRKEDAVPMVADTMALLPTKEIAFVSYRTGRNKEPMDVTITPVYHEVEWIPTTPAPSTGLNFALNIPVGEFRINLFNVFTNVKFQEGDVVTMPFYTSASEFTYYRFTVTAELVAEAYAYNPATDVRNAYILRAIGDGLGAQFGALPIAPLFPTLVGSDLRYITSYTPTYAVGQIRNFIFQRRTLSQPDHIKGAHYQYGVEYSDPQGRSYTVWTNEDLSMYVPFYSEQSAIDERAANFININNPYTITASITLNHIPPIGAAYYRIVRRNTTDISSFQEVTMVAMVPDGDRWKITLQGNNANYDYQPRYKGASINSTISKGDKVRFIRQHTGNVAEPVANDSLYVQSYFELEVGEYDEANRYIWVQKFDPSLINFVVAADVAQLLQIYTPQPSLDTNGNLFVAPWKELSQVYEILDPHTESRRHQGSFGLTGDVSSQGNIGDPQAFTAVDLGDHDPDGRTVVFTNDAGDTETFTIVETAFDGVSEWKISLGAETFTFDFSAAAGGRFNIQQDQIVSAGVSLLAATVSDIQGDVWFRQREYGTGYTTLNTRQYFFINDPWYSDYWVESKTNDNGRTSVESPFVQMVYKYATALHGGKLIDNTQINNLCVFELLYDGETPLNIKEMDDQWGPVEASIVDGKTLKCIQKKKENSIYINFAGFAITPDNGQEILPQQGSTFSQWRPYDSNFGTSDAGSVVLVPGKGIAYFDRISGVFIMSLNNGQVEISNYIQREGGSYDSFKYKQRTLELTNLCRTYPTFIVSYVDETNAEIGWGFVSEVAAADETVGTITNNSPLMYFTGDYTGYEGVWVTVSTIVPSVTSITGYIITAVYNEDTGLTLIRFSVRPTVTSASAKVELQPKYQYSLDTFDYVRMVWRTRYDYDFQRFANIGNKLFGFGSNANIYKHNIDGAITWHEKAATEKLIFVSNKVSNIMKRFTNLILKSTKKWRMPLAETTDALSYGTQQTSLSEDEFSVKGNLISARIKRDINSPNFATPAQARISGNEMRGQAIEITIEREVDGQTVTFGAVVRGQESETII